MKTEIINIKTEPATKKQAQKVAEKIGLSLSTIMNGLLKDFLRTQTVYFTAYDEQPSPGLISELRQADLDRKQGRVSHKFNNAKDSLAWLNNPKRRYVNGKQ
jgi:addiction module RelB/DinJ family antitoxin